MGPYTGQMGKVIVGARMRARVRYTHAERTWLAHNLHTRVSLMCKFYRKSRRSDGSTCGFQAERSGEGSRTNNLPVRPRCQYQCVAVSSQVEF